MNTCLLLADDEDIWLAYAVRDYDHDLTQAECWPWTKLSPSQWKDLESTLRFAHYLLDYVQPILLAISPLGVIGSACSIAAVWRRSVIKREHFFIWMLLIGLADFFFSLFYIPLLLNYDNGKVVDNIYKHSYAGSVIASILPGFTSSLSLASDLFILALTIERYIGVCKPTTPMENANRWRLCGGFLIVAVSSLRFVRSAVEFKTVEADREDNQTEIEYTQQEVIWITRSPVYTGLVFFSEVILPFLLLMPMIYLSSRIAYSTATRNRARMNGTVSVNRQQEKQDQTTSILRLLIILVVLYLLCQLGYCLYAVRQFVQEMTTITFESTYGDLRTYVYGKVYISLSIFIAYVMECLSRSVNFYLYYWLSASIREEFKMICRSRAA